MLDIALKQGKFTWTNRRTRLSHIAARLDRFLLHRDWLLEGWNITSNIIASRELDHKPISLKFQEGEDLDPIPFRFSPIWFQENGVMDLITTAWNTPVTGSTRFVWESKLKEVKHSLKQWDKEHFCLPHLQKNWSSII